MVNGQGMQDASEKKKVPNFVENKCSIVFTLLGPLRSTLPVVGEPMPVVGQDSFPNNVDVDTIST